MQLAPPPYEKLWRYYNGLLFLIFVLVSVLSRLLNWVTSVSYLEMIQEVSYGYLVPLPAALSSRQVSPQGRGIRKTISEHSTHKARPDDLIYLTPHLMQIRFSLLYWRKNIVWTCYKHIGLRVHVGTCRPRPDSPYARILYVLFLKIPVPEQSHGNESTRFKKFDVRRFIVRTIRGHFQYAKG